MVLLLYSSKSFNVFSAACQVSSHFPSLAPKATYHVLLIDFSGLLSCIATALSTQRALTEHWTGQWVGRKSATFSPKGSIKFPLGKYGVYYVYFSVVSTSFKL